MNGSEPRKASDLMPTVEQQQSSEHTQPSGSPTAGAPDPTVEARLAVIDAVFVQIWGGRWRGLTVEIDGLEEFDPMSVWRNNVIGLTGRQFEHGIEECKRSASNYPPTPGQFRELCKAAGDDPVELERKRIANYHVGRKLTDEERIEAREKLAKLRAMLG